MKAIRKTYITDATDSRRKVGAVRSMAQDNAVMALKMAQAIAKDVTLLKGLSKVVASLLEHPGAQAILSEVFARPGVKETYKAEFSILQKQNLEAIFA